MTRIIDAVRTKITDLRESRVLGFSVRQLLVSICNTLFILSIVASFVILTPTFPRMGTDPSWIQGVNAVTDARMAFGEDFIFTYGPYAALSTKAFSPKLDWLMFPASIFLAFCFSVVGLMVFGNRAFLPKVLFLFSLVAFSTSELLFSSYLLLVALAVYKMVNKLSVGTGSLTARDYSGVVFLSAGIALISLVKVSYLASAILILLPVSLYALRMRGAKILLFALVTYIVSVTSLWVLSGQALASLPEFVLNSRDIVGGYTEAMAIDPRAVVWPISLYLIAVCAFLGVLVASEFEGRAAKILLIATFGAFYFSAFKLGFVRHDGHAYTAGGAVIIGCSALLALRVSWQRFALFLFAVFVWASIHVNLVGKKKKHQFRAVTAKVSATCEGAIEGFYKRFFDYKSFENTYWADLAKISAVRAVPKVEGSCDVYPKEISGLIASGNIWSPRPIFQSYSAYTPKLADLNRQHLLSDKSPENIFFEIDPRDNRFPTIEDGSSLPLILRNYKLVGPAGPSLHLRRDGFVQDVALTPVISSSVAVLGEKVQMPESTGGALYFTADVEKSPLGKLASLAYKPSLLRIRVTLLTGEEKTFRIPSQMAKAGFMINPFVADTEGFAALYAGEDAPRAETITAFEIYCDSWESHWKKTYNYSLSRFDLPAQTQK